MAKIVYIEDDKKDVEMFEFAAQQRGWQPVLGDAPNPENAFDFLQRSDNLRLKIDAAMWVAALKVEETRQEALNQANTDYKTGDDTGKDGKK